MRGVALAVASKEAPDVAGGAPYYQAKVYLMHVLEFLGLQDRISFEPLQDFTDAASVYYLPGRSATVKIDDMVIGQIGEYKKSVQKSLKLPEYVAGFELDLALLMQVAPDGSQYVPLSRFPSISQDICFQAVGSVSYAELTGQLQTALARGLNKGERVKKRPIDLYTSAGLDGQKRITYRVTLTSYERTLTEEVLTNLLNMIAGKLSETLGAQRI